jgi:hypothetical protein
MKLKFLNTQPLYVPVKEPIFVKMLVCCFVYLFLIQN